MVVNDKKGQVLLLGVMIAVFVFIFAVITAPVIKDMTDWARAPDQLDCNNTSITTGNKMTCLAIDLYLPYFFGAVIAGSIAYLFIQRVQQVA